MAKQIVWLNEVKKAAVTLFGVVLGGVISLSGVYLQTRFDREKSELSLKREKLETLVNLALQIETGLNKIPSLVVRGAKPDGFDVVHQLRQLKVLTQIYFPGMEVTVDAYSKKVLTSLDGVVACEMKAHASNVEREKCLVSAVESVSTDRELQVILDMVRQEMKRLGT